MFAHLNLSFIRNRSELLKEHTKDNIDIVVISKTKIDNTFANSQFLVGGFSTPYRLDRGSNFSGILL